MNSDFPFIILRNHRKRQPLAEISVFGANQFKSNVLKEKPN